MLIILVAILQIVYFVTCLHYFQWKGYYKLRYLKYLFKNKLIILLNLILIIQLVLNLLKISDILNIFNLILLFFNFFILFLFLFKSKKIKFIFTSRILRLIILNTLLILPFWFTNIKILIVLLILEPIWLIVLDLLDIQKYIIDNKFLNLAINKLESNKNLIVIGITGSNGKTSVKEILNKILSSQYKVITTQKNQNTPKGSIIAINKYLTNDTDIFICEMGARKTNDIKNLCTLVNPSKAIITSVSPQHLETFKNENNIYLTKKELPDYINKGYCVYNIDNKPARQMHNEKVGQKGSISINSKADLYASNIKIINYETYFDIHYQGNIYPCHTKLLGEHNVTNILLALNLSIHLNVDINKAIQSIVTLQPIPHRLQYIKSHIDIIDDSYNCSIDSAHQAIKVLSQINKTKVICTPGIIEGGNEQFNLNSKLSSMLSKCADILIIVGKTNRKALISKLENFELIYIPNNNLYSTLTKHKQIIKIGKLQAKQTNISNISLSTKKRAYIVDTLDIAKQLFNKILNNSHILLLLNDLPDEYN